MIEYGHFEGPGGIEIQIICRSRSYSANTWMTENAVDVRRYLTDEAHRVQASIVQVMSEDTDGRAAPAHLVSPELQKPVA